MNATFDHDGRLHLSSDTPIFVAGVATHLGSEIPGHRALGLDPERRYRLLRHPDELARAAPTFNMLPVTARPLAVTPDACPPGAIVGMISNRPRWANGAIRNGVSLWTRRAIDALARDHQLSATYRHRVDMTPGEYRGRRYDGVLRDIVANSMSLVRESRPISAGDEAPMLVPHDLPPRPWLELARRVECV